MNAPLVRGIGKLAAGLILLGLLAGCAGPTPAPGGTAGAGNGGEAASTGTAVPNGKPAVDRIIVGLSQDPTDLAPGAGTAYVSSAVKNALGTEIRNQGTAQLVWRNERNELIPGVAESVPLLNENNPDDCAQGACFKDTAADRYLEVTYRLRRNVKWHDGSPVTANDARFAWEYVAYSFLTSPLERKIQSVRVVDSNTIVYNYRSERQALEVYARTRALGFPDESNPFTDFKDQKGPLTDPLYNRIGYVIPEKTYASIAPTALRNSEYNATRENGLGAFSLKAREPGQAITLKANPDFFLGAPRIQEIQFRVIADTQQLLKAVREKAVDVVLEDAFDEFTAPELDMLVAQGRVKPYYMPSLTWEHLAFNLDRPGLANIKVRQAIALAINRQELVDKVLNGKTRVSHSWISAQSPFYNPEVFHWPYDPEAGEALLREAGYLRGVDGVYVQGGVRLALKLSTTAGNKRRQLVIERIAADLKRIGIAIQLDYVQGRSLFEGAGKGLLSGRTFDLALYANTLGDEPGGADLWRISAIPSPANGYAGQNYAGWRDPEQDKAIQAAATELSLTKRVEAYRLHQKRYAEDLPDLPLYGRVNVTVAPQALEGFRPGSATTPPTWNVHEWYLPAKA